MKIEKTSKFFYYKFLLLFLILITSKTYLFFQNHERLYKSQFERIQWQTDATFKISNKTVSLFHSKSLWKLFLWGFILEKNCVFPKEFRADTI